MRASTAYAASGRAITGFEIQLGDLGEVLGEPGHAQQEVLQRGQVSGRGTSVPEQQRRRADPVHLAHGLEVAGCGRTDLGRRPIGEERVHAR